jgi:IS30 family transposase
MKYKHLSQKEREEIFLYLQEGKKRSEIARMLSRSPSSIGREISRNSSVIDRRKNSSKKKKKHYLPDKAEGKYKKRRKESKSPFPLKNHFIYRYTIGYIKEGWSPEQISGRLEYDYKERHEISHECIYQFIYSKRGKEMKLYEYLPRHHTKRRKFTGRKSRKGKIIPNRMSIHKRPIEIELRVEGGHFEGDSIVGVGKGSALHTEVERVSRYLEMRKILQKTAEETKKAMIDIFSSLPLKKTCTLDNGCEFTQHEQVSEKTEIDIYFADPYSSYQRGTNENGNGLIRRFYPKKTNFDTISKEEIQRIQDIINNRPRKCLGYRTPKEVYDELCKKYLF